MKMIDKQKLISHKPDRAPLCGFAGYVSKDQPRLLRRIGWEISNDIHDDFSDQMSNDNGRTWSEIRPSLCNKQVEGGYICHTENQILLLPDGRLAHFTNDKFEASLGGCDLSCGCKVRITVGTPEEISCGKGESLVSDFGLKQGLMVSFMTANMDARGRFLAPIQWQKQDADGSIRRRGIAIRGKAMDVYSSAPYGTTRNDLTDIILDVWEVGLLIGEFGRDGRLIWRRTGPVPCDFESTSRGLYEAALAELPGGGLVMVIRGSNAHWLDKPGYKWLTCSNDGGETWSSVVPLPCSDGSLIESSATGSALFRSIKNSKLYWIGNLCLDGRHPNGNMPRSPLYIAEMQEDLVAIKRKTITVIDQAQPSEHPDTQHSNFKFYQDRETGDIVLYLTRYGARGYENNSWMLADLYQYRIALEK